MLYAQGEVVSVALPTVHDSASAPPQHKALVNSEGAGVVPEQQDSSNQTSSRLVQAVKCELQVYNFGLKSAVFSCHQFENRFLVCKTV